MTKERSEVFVARAMREVAAQKIVLDVGGGERFGKWMKLYAPLFSASEYKTFDFDASTGADVVGDIHAIPLPDASVHAVICSSVLEHVKDPRKAMDELYRILTPNGLLFFFVPSTYPYHARPGHYPDYWRFFGDTIDDLFSRFSEKEIKKRGGYFLALSFFIPGQARMRFILTPVAEWLDMLFKTERRHTTAGYYVLARK